MGIYQPIFFLFADDFVKTGIATATENKNAQNGGDQWWSINQPRTLQRRHLYVDWSPSVP